MRRIMVTGPTKALRTYRPRNREGGGEAVPDRNTVATPEAVARSSRRRSTRGSHRRIDLQRRIVRDVTFAKMPFDNLDAVLAVNLLSAFYVGQPAFQAMKPKETVGGSSSLARRRHFRKFRPEQLWRREDGVVGLSRTLAIEGARTTSW